MIEKLVEITSVRREFCRPLMVLTRGRQISWRTDVILAMYYHHHHYHFRQVCITINLT